MAYSCSDFTDHVLNALVNAGLVKDSEIESDNPEAQARVAVAAINRLASVWKEERELLAFATSGLRDTHMGFPEREIAAPDGDGLRGLLRACVSHLRSTGWDDEGGWDCEHTSDIPVLSERVLGPHGLSAVLPGAVAEEVVSVIMADLVGEYCNPGTVPEWRWVEEVASFAHVGNGTEQGVWDFIVNLAKDLPHIPAKLQPVVDTARQVGVGYLIFHQGT